jgi:hypothetical protein
VRIGDSILDCWLCKHFSSLMLPFENFYARERNRLLKMIILNSFNFLFEIKVN